MLGSLNTTNDSCKFCKYQAWPCHKNNIEEVVIYWHSDSTCSKNIE